MNKIDQDKLRDFVLRHYKEQEKEALRELLKWEKALMHLEASTLNSELYQTFLTQIRTQATAIQDEVSRRVLGCVQDEIRNLLEKENK